MIFEWARVVVAVSRGLVRVKAQTLLQLLIYKLWRLIGSAGRFGTGRRRARDEHLLHLNVVVAGLSVYAYGLVGQVLTCLDLRLEHFGTHRCASLYFERIVNFAVVYYAMTRFELGRHVATERRAGAARLGTLAGAEGDRVDVSLGLSLRSVLGDLGGRCRRPPRLLSEHATDTIFSGLRFCWPLRSLPELTRSSRGGLLGQRHQVAILELVLGGHLATLMRLYLGGHARQQLAHLLRPEAVDGVQPDDVVVLVALPNPTGDELRQHFLRDGTLTLMIGKLVEHDAHILRRRFFTLLFRSEGAYVGSYSLVVLVVLLEDGVLLNAMHQICAEMLAIFDIFHEELLAFEQFYIVEAFYGCVRCCLCQLVRVRARTGSFVLATLSERKVRQLLNLQQRLEMLLDLREDVLYVPVLVSESD